MEPHGGQPIETAGAPLAESRGVVILVHGRNAAPANILSLVPQLNRPDFTYLAPAAAHRTWYPHSFLAPRHQNEPGLTSGLTVLRHLVADLAARGVERRRVAIVGFSQGACLSSEFVYRNPGRYGGLVAFTGGLIGEPGITWSFGGRLEGTPVFLGSSDVDAHVPVERVRETADVFTRMGADVTLRVYAGMGHQVNADEIAHAQAVLDSISVL